MRLYYLEREGRAKGMDTREEALRLYRELLPKLLECGTEVDAYFRQFRELRLRESDLSFQGALLNAEHAFFMVVQSMNVLREHLKLLEVAAKKKEIG